MNQMSMIQVLASQRINSTKQNTQNINKQFIEIYGKALSYSNLILHEQIECRNVIIYQKQHMHQIYTNSTADLPHLVLLHGFGGTALTFVRIFQLLKDSFQVHALDLYGCGLSSLGQWNDQFTPDKTKQYYIQAIQQWRKTVKIQQFYLLGHSFGGFIATLYFQKYTTRVKHLFLLSPAGSGKFTQEEIEQYSKNRKCFFWLGKKLFNLHIKPSRTLNWYIFGGCILQKLLSGRLGLVGQEKQIWGKYLKFLSRIQQTAQRGFYTLFSWPIQPYRSIQQILSKLKPSIKIDFLFGDIDWMNQNGANRLIKEYPNIRSCIILGAGHQIIFDNPQKTAQMIKEFVKK